MTTLHKEGSLWSFDYELHDTCESCLLGKMMKLLFKGKGEHATGPLDNTYKCMWSNVHTCHSWFHLLLYLQMTIHGTCTYIL